MMRHARLTRRALVLAIFLTAPAGRSETDHLVGYRLKDERAVAPGEHTLVDALVTQGCKVTKAKFLMVPGSKNFGDDPRGGVPGQYVCYRARCTDRPDADVAVNDQFGAGNATAIKAKLVCTPMLPCTGAQISGFCWYLGAFDQSCNQVCTAAGMAYSTATESYAGSGGSFQACGEVLDALGFAPGAVNVGTCSEPWECAGVNGGTTRFQCTNTPADPDASDPGVQRACACQ